MVVTVTLTEDVVVVLHPSIWMERSFVGFFHLVFFAKRSVLVRSIDKHRLISAITDESNFVPAATWPKLQYTPGCRGFAPR